MLVDPMTRLGLRGFFRDVDSYWKGVREEHGKIRLLPLLDFSRFIHCARFLSVLLLLKKIFVVHYVRFLSLELVGSGT